MVNYCYKVKHGYIKINPFNAYKRPKIEEYGFMLYLPEDNSDDEIVFAKWINLPEDCSIANWMKSDLEKIHKKGEDKWVKELVDSGYEFDEEGKLIINEAFRKGLTVQLCISSQKPYNGCLFINVGGHAEFYEKSTLDECAPAEIIPLVANGVVYEKRLKEE